MRLGGGSRNFDLSDLDVCGVDSIDGALELAAEVLEEFGGEGAHRMQRLARFVIAHHHLDAIQVARAGTLLKYEADGVVVVRCGADYYGVELDDVGAHRKLIFRSPKIAHNIAALLALAVEDVVVSE